MKVPFYDVTVEFLYNFLNFWCAYRK